MDCPRYWYVINAENNTSMTDDGNEAECFDNEAAAVARAQQLAQDCPGDIYEVVATVAAFVAPICDVESVIVKT